MIKLEFNNGHKFLLKNRWEELSGKEYLTILDYLSKCLSGKNSIPKLRVMILFLLTGLNGRLHKDSEKADRQSLNIYKISQQLTFMLRIEYKSKKSFNSLNRDIKNKLERYLPEELDVTPITRWATKSQKTIIPDLVFAANLLPEIKVGRKLLKGYTFTLNDRILSTSLTTSQFITAQTVSKEVSEKGDEYSLNILVAILYSSPYDSLSVMNLAKRISHLEMQTKKAIYFNFNAIQAFLSTKTKYSILFGEPDPKKKKPKIDLGLESVALSLIKTGYSNIEESNLIHFFEIMYSELIQNVTNLHHQGIAIDKISEQTGLTLKTINQIL